MYKTPITNGSSAFLFHVGEGVTLSWLVKSKPVGLLRHNDSEIARATGVEKMAVSLFMSIAALLYQSIRKL